MKMIDIAIEHTGDTLIVRLCGELDHHQADTVRTHMESSLSAPHVRHIVLNCAQLTFMDSSGIGVILGRYKQIIPRQGKLLICNANETVHRLMELAGLFKIATLVKDEGEAMQHVGVLQ
ncbi:MAG: anti-sigma F factor antagonist [Paenibacillaceae bacterium]|jgi:stage II sporulation protein AA (anti-sigma F factor antagonist)|nr:anti-sigma F factor antagonist [Paenibacillaceae bacterium]